MNEVDARLVKWRIRVGSLCWMAFLFLVVMFVVGSVVPIPGPIFGWVGLVVMGIGYVSLISYTMLRGTRTRAERIRELREIIARGRHAEGALALLMKEGA